MKFQLRTAVTGFSLVELSIVLVIIGLLVGGILAGRSLIRASELRSVIIDYERFKTAALAFRDRYFYLPGDMPNASSVWGAADGTTGSTVACASTASTTATTCNGNGNGLLDIPGSSNEYFRFWQHLANAGMIEGSYSGISLGGTNYVTTANAPSGKMSSSLWYALYRGTLSGNASIFDGFYGNALQFGAYVANSDPAAPIIKPEEGWNIDSKIDDGKPALGTIVARDLSGFGGYNCTTATASSMTGADYYLPNANKRCALYFRQIF